MTCCVPSVQSVETPSEPASSANYLPLPATHTTQQLPQKASPLPTPVTVTLFAWPAALLSSPLPAALAMLATATEASYAPSDLPETADWSSTEGWDPTTEGWTQEDEDMVTEAAVRVQAAMRAKVAKNEVERRRSSEIFKPSQSLSLELLKPRASAIAPTADGLGFAHTRCDASGLRLGGSLVGVGCLRHLRTLDLSDNRLISLAGLEELPALATLVCKRNRLLTVLDFPAAPGLAGSSLRHADLRGNAISGAVSMPPESSNGGRPLGVQAHAKLEALLLDENQLRSLRGLAAVPQLTLLSAASNQLIDTAGAGGLLKLESVDLTDNSLTSCDELATLTAVRTLRLGGNQLDHVPDLSALRQLRTLDLSNNQLMSLEALATAIGHGASSRLGTSPLRTLTLLGNPLEHDRPDLRLDLLHLLPELTQFDGVDTTCEEHVFAHNKHGADWEDLRNIRRPYFPDSIGSSEEFLLPYLRHLYKTQYTQNFRDGKATDLTK